MLLIGSLALPGCLGPDSANDLDPFEGFNRRIFKFNEALDTYVIGPLAVGWDAIVPGVVQLGLSHFISNLRTPLNVANHLLQGGWSDAGHETRRFLINTTYGLLGFRDKADDLDYVARPTDFGMTLAAWGVPPGPYIVLPVLGPATVRSAAGMPVDWPPQTEIYETVGLRATGTRVGDRINDRALYARDIEQSRERAFDFYRLVRDAYLQTRDIELYPDDPEDWKEFDDAEAEADAHADAPMFAPERTLGAVSSGPAGPSSGSRQGQAGGGRESYRAAHLVDMLERQARQLLAKRHLVYEAARRRRP